MRCFCSGNAADPFAHTGGGIIQDFHLSAVPSDFGVGLSVLKSVFHLGKRDFALVFVRRRNPTAKRKKRRNTKKPCFLRCVLLPFFEKVIKGGVKRLFH